MPDNEITVTFNAEDNISNVANKIDKNIEGIFDPAGIARVGEAFTIATAAAIGAGIIIEKIAKEFNEIVKLSEKQPELFTSSQISDVERYSDSIDNLTDSWNKVRIAHESAIMGDLAPVLDRASMVIDTATTNTGYLRAEYAKMSVQTAQTSDEVDIATESFMSYDKALLTVNRETELTEQQQNNIEAALKGSARAAKENEQAIKDMTRENQSWLSSIGTLTSEQERLEDNLQNIKDQQVELLDKKKKLIAQGWWAESEKIQNLNDKINENEEKYNEYTIEYELNTRRRILAMLEERLSIDGLDGAETQYLENKMVEWGLATQEAINQTRRERDEVQLLIDTLNGVPHEIRTNIFVSTNTDANANRLLSGQGPLIGGGGFAGYRASGGDVTARQSYIVGERGPELFTPGQSGNITPNHQMGGMDEERLGRIIGNVLARYLQ